MLQRISSCMLVLRSTPNILWKRWIEHGQQYAKTRRSLWNLAFANISTYQNFTQSSTTSLQSGHMGPLMATTQSLQSVFILILRRCPSGQVTSETTWHICPLIWLAMKGSDVTRHSCAGRKERVLSKKRKKRTMARPSQRGN